MIESTAIFIWQVLFHIWALNIFLCTLGKIGIVVFQVMTLSYVEGIVTKISEQHAFSTFRLWNEGNMLIWNVGAHLPDDWCYSSEDQNVNILWNRKVHVVSEGLWRWWITQGISGFLDFIHRPVFEGTRRLGNWICFRPQVKGEERRHPLSWAP
jgi:hypothetical protein